MDRFSYGNLMEDSETVWQITYSIIPYCLTQKRIIFKSCYWCLRSAIDCFEENTYRTADKLYVP